jgi:mannitol/fructose-specific phosphotransferase system IIA component (Ntr-type)
MKLSELIVPELLEVPFRAADKWQALAAIALVPRRAGRYAERMVPVVEQALVQRERKATTGMEYGIAIPHALVDGIDDLIAVLGISHDGIPFDSLDQNPARIVVALIIPRQKQWMHIKTLAEIARLLSRADVRQRLLACTVALEVVRALGELDRAPSGPAPGPAPGSGANR